VCEGALVFAFYPLTLLEARAGVNFFDENDMAESDNLLTKQQDLVVYDNATGTHVVRLAFVSARCS
jgi:hypothetical protein